MHDCSICCVMVGLCCATVVLLPCGSRHATWASGSVCSHCILAVGPWDRAISPASQRWWSPPLPCLRPSGGTVLCAGLLCRRPSELLYPPPHCGAREARQILDLGIGEARANEIADLHLFFSESSEPLCKKTSEVGVDFVDGGIEPPPILGSHLLDAAGRFLDRFQHVASSSLKF